MIRSLVGNLGRADPMTLDLFFLSFLMEQRLWKVPGGLPGPTLSDVLIGSGWVGR